MVVRREPGRPTACVGPEYRNTLANERTFLAWIRTALALLAGAVAVTHLVPPLASDVVRSALALLLAATGLALPALAWVRWAASERAMRLGHPLPRPLALVLVSSAVMVVGALVVALTLLGRG